MPVPLLVQNSLLDSIVRNLANLESAYCQNVLESSDQQRALINFQIVIQYRSAKDDTAPAQVTVVFSLVYYSYSSLSFSCRGFLDRLLPFHLLQSNLTCCSGNRIEFERLKFCGHRQR